MGKPQGLEGVEDFLGYSFPMLAGIVAGMAILYPRWQTLYFWLSLIALCMGLVFYLMSKNVGNVVYFYIVAAFFVPVILMFLLVIDEYVNFFNFKRKFSLSRVITGASFSLYSIIVIIFIYNFFSATKKIHPAEICNIKVDTPITVSMAYSPNTTPTSQPGGDSLERSTGRNIVITFHSCPK